jgi:hypothetical protein
MLDSLHNAGNLIVTSVKDERGTNIKQLYPTLVLLTNTGSAPILPTDVYGKFKLVTKDPWVIIAITSGAGNGSPAFSWHRLSDTEFEADPILINPQDIALSTAYMI